jgi:tetratricopeptide (TPR) repeat protein
MVCEQCASVLETEGRECPHCGRPQSAVSDGKGSSPEPAVSLPAFNPFTVEPLRITYHTVQWLAESGLMQFTGASPFKSMIRDTSSQGSGLSDAPEEALRARGIDTCRPIDWRSTTSFVSEGDAFRYSLGILAAPEHLLSIITKEPRKSLARSVLYIAHGHATAGYVRNGEFFVGAPIILTDVTTIISAQLCGGAGADQGLRISLSSFQIGVISQLWKAQHQELTLNWRQAEHALTAAGLTRNQSQLTLTELIEKGALDQSAGILTIQDSYRQCLELLWSGHSVELGLVPLQSHRVPAEKADSKRLAFVGPPGSRILFETPNHGSQTKSNDSASGSQAAGNGTDEQFVLEKLAPAAAKELLSGFFADPAAEAPLDDLRPAEGSGNQNPIGPRHKLSKLRYLGVSALGVVAAGVLSTMAILNLRTGKPATASILLGLTWIPSLLLAVTLLTLTYRMWNAIQDGQVPISPWKAVGCLLIPIFNLYWFFRAVWGFAQEYNRFVERHRVNTRKLPESLFLAYCVLCFTAWIPLLGILTGVVSLGLLFAGIWRVCDAVNVLVSVENAQVNAVTATGSDSGSAHSLRYALVVSGSLFVLGLLVFLLTHGQIHWPLGRNDNPQRLVMSGPIIQVPPAILYENSPNESRSGSAAEPSTDDVTRARDALSRRPRDPKTLNDAGSIIGSAGDWDTGDKLLAEAIQRAPTEPVIAYNYARGLLKQGKAAEAIEQADNAIHLKPDFDEAHLVKAAADVQLGRIDDAQKEIQDLIKKGVEIAYIIDGVIKLSKKQIRAASASFQQAIRMASSDSTARFDMGVASQLQNSLPTARGLYQQALATNPDFAEAHNNLGVVLSQEGNQEAAFQEIHQAAILKADDQSIQQNLSHSLHGASQLPDILMGNWQIDGGSVHISGIDKGQPVSQSMQIPGGVMNVKFEKTADGSYTLEASALGANIMTSFARQPNGSFRGPTVPAASLPGASQLPPGTQDTGTITFWVRGDTLFGDTVSSAIGPDIRIRGMASWKAHRLH